MKKVVLTVILTALAVCIANSQPRAVGGHLGYQIGAEYQHTLGKNFVEADLEVPGYIGGFIASSQYNWVIASPAWTSKGEWNFYAGPGLATGVVGNYFYLGFSGQLGLSYKFWFPMMLSFDWRPKLGVAFGENTRFYDAWAYIFAPTIGIKYCF